MSVSDEQRQMNWWAQGDTPVHRDSRVTYMVDGQTAMFTMCLHFLKARQYIYLANWGLTPALQLVRGQDHRAGPDSSPEQEQLLYELRASGLAQEEIDFWCTNELTVQAVLGYMVKKGVEVKALLWAAPEFFSHYSPQEAHDQLTEVGVTCILDDSSHGILHHPAESLHQKISVVDGLYAFVGGIDPLIEGSGDFDRWDTHTHLYSTPLRRMPQKPDITPHPWHDAHALIEGPAAGDVELNFRQRWNDVVGRKSMDASLLIPEHPVAPPQESRSFVQVARTIPQHTYKFTPEGGIQGIAQLYASALSNAQRFIYLENQYLWLRSFIGLDVAMFGPDNADMEYNLVKMGEALKRGATVTIVLPDHPNVGRAFSDAGLARLKEEAPEAVEAGRLRAFCLATSGEIEGKIHYRPIYVHAKVGLIDDVWATVGSGNLNNRGMRDDTEMNVATLDARLARGLRLMLWGEHMGWLQQDDLLVLSRHLGGQPQHPQRRARAEELWPFLEERFGDVQQGLDLMYESAQRNLERYKAGQPLVGHLLPYLTAEEATQQGLNFAEEHGWIEEERGEA